MKHEVVLKFVTMAIFALASSQCCGQDSGIPEVDLIPWPQEIEVLDAQLELTTSSRVVYGDQKLQPLAEVLCQELHQVTGLALHPSTKTAGKGDILIKIDPALDGQTYIVNVSDHVEIRGADYKNTTIASATLLQAAKRQANRVFLPRMAIKDWPHSSYRSLLIDIARQPHTIDTLKQCIMLCRLYKISSLQLHLSDDQSFAFECKAFPKLASEGRHFTQEELKDLVAFADARGVMLIPELDAPGHTTAMRRAMPELFGRPGLSVINIGKEEVMMAMETIIEELCGIFHSSDYFHIGADEAYFAVLAKDELAQKAIKEKEHHGVHDLFYEYIVRMHKKVKQLGKKTVMWESFQGRGSERVEIPREILVMAWETAYQLPESLLNNGYNIVNVSWKPLYLTPGWRWDPEYIYNWNMCRWENHWQVAPSYVPIQLKPYPNDRIIGGMMCSWESRDEMEVPGVRLRIAPMSEQIWSPNQKHPYEHFARRFAHTDEVLQRLIRPVVFEVEGLTAPDYVGPFYNRENRFGKAITATMTPAVPGTRIYYTLDGTIPTKSSTRYRRPLSIEKTTTLRTQVYDAAGNKLGFIATIPYEHHPVIGQVEGLLMQVRHDNGRGRHRTKFGKQVTINLHTDMPEGVIRYTTNGRQPTGESPQYTGPIVLNRSGVVTARYFDPAGKPQGESWRRAFDQIDAETNLTTGKPVSASGVAAPHTLPEMAVDGIIDRNFHWDSSAGAPQWWQIDLEASHKLNRIQVVTYWDGHRYYKYRVEASLDGETWSEVADFSQNTMKATERGFMHTFDPIISRYIRVTMLYNSANPGLHLVEVRAFADGD